jgi:hypothetical protein
MTRHALLTYAEKYWGSWRRRTIAGVVWLEALARQSRAVLAGRPSGLHAELRRLAADWIGGHSLAARWRIRRATKLLAGCAGQQDRAIPPDVPATPVAG